MLALTLAVPMTACGSQNSVNTTEQVQEEVQEEVQEGVQDATQVQSSEIKIEGASYIELSDEEILFNGDSITGNTEAEVYAANDIVYYEAGKDFTYGEGTKEDEHTKEEADAHTVVHITKPGTYVISGKLSAGQIAVDLGKEAEDDREAVVTLVLDGADITCTVAPAVIFYNVYECSSDDEEEAVKEVDTSAAGANVLIADNSVNNVTGSYVARIYKSVELNEEGTEVVDSKKLHKYDAAFYSKMTMNMNGGEADSGVLNIRAENEGLDSELHLTINGGKINIVSGNDGINTNEDKVSVTTINGGFLNIAVDGSSGEGDGIDSNGWLVINGGVVNASACATSMDAGIDSDMGIHINGGTVIATGNMLDHISDSEQNYVVFTFQNKVKGGEEITLVKDEESHFLTMSNDFTYLLVSKATFGEEGAYTLWKGEEQLSVVEISDEGMRMPPDEFRGQRPEMPEGFKPGEMPEGLEEGQMPEGFKPGEIPEGFEPGKMPGGGRGGKGGFGQVNMEDAVTEFEIKNGSNMFMVVSIEK